VKLYQPDPDSGEAFAETRPDAPLYRINPLVIKDLSRELFTLQDKRLLGIDYTEIAMLSVKTRDKQYVLINENGQWVLEDQPTEKLSQEAADLLVSRVANLPAEERVTKQAAALAPYGLVAPTAEFVATGRDGKIAGRLTLGSQAGNLIYATGFRPKPSSWPNRLTRTLHHTSRQSPSLKMDCLPTWESAFEKHPTRVAENIQKDAYRSR
ncbi:MAG: DUF4340 domain-containing protein, partial [Nitrospira sp.]|nr:DUF4340 domain-containing protein [Nitrospira sp.]